MNITGILAASTAALAISSSAITLEEGFRAPPASARPHTWYHMMNGNVTKEGITCDFEALAKAGVGGVQMFDAGCNIPAGSLDFNSPAWFDMFAHAQREAKRLGLEICIPNCSGWSSSGGPWNKPANAMKIVTTREVQAKGPSKFKAKLPRENRDNGFYEDIAVLAYPTPRKGAEVKDLRVKTLRSFGRLSQCLSALNSPGKGDCASDQLVARDGQVDLTAKMQKDGTLEWDVPEGDWTILRVGYICNGRCNHPASKCGRGLEVDKLSASAMDFHFDQYVARLCKTLGISDKTDNSLGFNNILVDSYEVDAQNWTQGFERIFEERMGYSLRPFLPVFSGRVVGSPVETERFLEDFRRVVADLFAENYAGRLTELCHRHGLMCSIEPYGNSPADDLQYGQDIDIPMGEFWSKAGHGDHSAGLHDSVRKAATIAHVWGRRYAAAESFTASPGPGGRWRTTPFSIKAQGDVVYANGINRIIYHRFTHQPWPGDKYLPGMTMGRWGMHFDRTQTWWRHAGEWIKYQTRCQWMLQEGVFDADVLYFCGEHSPNDASVPKDMRLPSGYDWDICTKKPLMSLKVVDGCLVVPGGVRYRLLALPPSEAMTEEILAKVGELVAAGAKVCCTKKPVRAQGLRGYPACDGRIRSLADEVWAKGVMTCSPAEAIARLGIAPDFASDERNPEPRYIHRHDGAADWYFVALNNYDSKRLEVSFRQTGRAPEVWDAVTGEIRPADVWREEGGRTYVTLEFSPSGSAFVVFRKAPEGDHVVTASVKQTGGAGGHTLVIKKAEYGAFGAGKPGCVVDITERLSAAVTDGSVRVNLGNDFAGCDPLYMTVKKSRVTYVYDGKERTVEIKENGEFAVPSQSNARTLSWEWRDGKIMAWKPIAGELRTAKGDAMRISANPPAPMPVEGGWEVSFPAGWDAPDKVVLPRLMSWTEHSDDGVKYFSGTATYAKTVSVPAFAEGSRLWLDLGDVQKFAEVTANGRTYPVLWKPPYRVDVTDAAKGAKELKLSIKVTNLWANRLIGDDRLYAEDCEWSSRSHKGSKEIAIRRLPQWVKEGKKSPTGRHTFTTWKHWSKEDDLLPSGILGPARLVVQEPASVSD